VRGQINAEADADCIEKQVTADLRDLADILMCGGKEHRLHRNFPFTVYGLRGFCSVLGRAADR
jgi:hypothetical protein